MSNEREIFNRIYEKWWKEKGKKLAMMPGWLNHQIAITSWEEFYKAERQMNN